MREQRKSVYQSVHDEQNSCPLPHVPGWIHHTVCFEIIKNSLFSASYDHFEKEGHFERLLRKCGNSKWPHFG